MGSKGRLWRCCRSFRSTVVISAASKPVLRISSGSGSPSSARKRPTPACSSNWTSSNDFCCSTLRIIRARRREITGSISSCDSSSWPARWWRKDLRIPRSTSITACCRWMMSAAIPIASASWWTNFITSTNAARSAGRTPWTRRPRTTQNAVKTRAQGSTYSRNCPRSGRAGWDRGVKSTGRKKLKSKGLTSPIATMSISCTRPWLAPIHPIAGTTVSLSNDWKLTWSRRSEKPRFIRSGSSLIWRMKRLSWISPQRFLGRRNRTAFSLILCRSQKKSHTAACSIPWDKLCLRWPRRVFRTFTRGQSCGTWVSSIPITGARWISPCGIGALMISKPLSAKTVWPCCKTCLRIGGTAASSFTYCTSFWLFGGLILSSSPGATTFR